MTVPFKNIPTNQRAPLFFAELDNSRANTALSPQRALLIGQIGSTGTLVPNVPTISYSQPDARAAAGPGSILARMVDAYRQNDPSGEMWVLPLVDDPAASAATGTITFTGPTTAVGTLSLYLAGVLLSVPLQTGQSATQVATTVAAAINAASDLVVTASATTGVITLTAKNKGLLGNDIDVQVNFVGTSANEVLPAGLTVAIVPMSGGTINPSLTTALSNLLDTPFDFIVCSLNDPTSLAAIAALLSDTGGRWSAQTQVYGHCFFAYRGTAGAAAAFATGLNNQHLSCIAFNGSPSSSWRWAAAFAGAAAVSLRQDPGLPLQTLPVLGIKAPPLASRFPQSTRNNTLLFSGCSTFTVDAGGTVYIENLITTYVTNAQGMPDDSYLQIETLFLLTYVLRFMSSMVTSKYSRKKLAAAGTRVLPGSNVITPDIVRADIIAAYRQMEAAGYVQQSEVFASNLVVEKDTNNVNRLNVLFPAVLIDQLRVFALLAQFRLS